MYSNVLISAIFRSNVFARPVLWWHFHHFWHRSVILCWSGSRRSYWSHGLRISPNDKMHIPQIWNIRWNWKTRRPVYSAFEHFQRKDLHLLVVLDAHLGRPYIPSCCLPFHHLRFIKYANILDEDPLSTDPDGVHRSHHGEIPSGWLVPDVLARTKHRPSHLQRCDARISQKDGLQKQRLYWVVNLLRLKALPLREDLTIYQGSRMIKEMIYINLSQWLSCYIQA